ncbi:NDP-sugar pyrophosphorylase family protein [Bradyrhizobium sp. USDA 326]
MRPSDLFHSPMDEEFEKWLSKFATLEDLFSSRDQLYAKLGRQQIEGTIEDQAIVTGLVYLGPNSHVKSGAVLSGPLIVGPDCVIECGARILGRSFIGTGSQLRAGSFVSDSIVMNRCTLCENSVVQNCVLGSDVLVRAGCLVGDAAAETPDRVAFVGDGARLGLGAIICPGSIVASSDKVAAGSIVRNPKGSEVYF